MSFVKLEKRVSVHDSKSGASMSMRVYKGAPTKAIAFLALRSNFLETTSFASATAFDVAIGTGENAGKIRLTPNAKGIFPTRRLKKGGALLIDLGHIPSLGDKPHGNQAANVALIDGAAVVTVPDWKDAYGPGNGEADDEEDDDEAETTQPQRETAPAKPVAAPRPVAQPSSDKKPVSVVHNGVVITLTEEAESIAFKGAVVDVSPRGARLVEALAKVKPACIGESQLLGILWGSNRPPSPLTHLDMVVRDLASLKKVGLEIRKQKGIGLQLVEAGK